MSEAVIADIGTRVGIVGPEALLTVRHRVTTDITGRRTIGRAVIAGRIVVIIGLLGGADDRAADQGARDAEADGGAAAAVSAATPAAAILHRFEAREARAV